MRGHNRYKGPTLPLSNEIDQMKYRQKDEDFHDKIVRLSSSMSDDEEHQDALMDIMGNMRYLAAGRVQAAMGSQRITTAYNCFVSGEVEDSMESIMTKAAEAAETMRRGGGIGYDFSKIRPKGDLIKSLDSRSSGPVSFMGIFDAVCQTIASSGHRRGAQMGILRIDHPDIYEFIRAKRNDNKLTGFNISVGVTDLFMLALTQEDDSFDLVFNGQTYKTISARSLWEEIMESTWDWAEPGVLYIDRVSDLNNLNYMETIAATNPCGEQPLPPYGACLLGSFNLTAYLTPIQDGQDFGYTFNKNQFRKDIPHIVRAMDNVIDRTIYPLKQQEDEAKNKRRMGLGITGLANAGELLGFSYGSREFNNWAEEVFKILRNGTYAASVELAKEKGPFPLFRPEYIKSEFIKRLPYNIKKDIKKYGIRNSHLTSIAPTGTISLVADNVSSGIEPVFSHSYTRTIQTFEGPRTEEVKDYAYERGVKGRASSEISIQEHLDILALASYYVDSAVSKTCNVGDEVDFNEFKEVYYKAWKEECKGITTFRASGKRFGILNETKEVEEEKDDSNEIEKVEACFIDPQTGQKECS